MLGILIIHLYIPSCGSLKEKRGLIRPLMNRLRRIFNLSVAELAAQDAWREAVIGCAMIANERAHLESALQAVARWVQGNWPDGDVVEIKIEIL